MVDSLKPGLHGARSSTRAASASDLGSERRVPCPKCRAMIIAGARKCRSCKQWIGADRRVSKSRTIALVAGAAVSLGLGLLARHPSSVADAPPLTPLGNAPITSENEAPADVNIDDTAPVKAERVLDIDDGEAPHSWRARNLPIDVHPLDIAFSAASDSLFVSADDASLREYDVRSGRLRRFLKVSARGDRIRLLHDRWVAMLQDEGATHIPVVDTRTWNRDPTLLIAGNEPVDIVAVPDTNTAVAASTERRRVSWFDLETGQVKANITLPHAARRLYLLQTEEGRPYVGVMGMLYRATVPAGAWIDIFDPSEAPFGATRRSISAGRDVLSGMVTADGHMLFFADHASNAASLLRVDQTAQLQTASVGQGPVAAFMFGDRYGITLDAGAQTATVVDIAKMQRVTSLKLPSPPKDGAIAPNGNTLFVSLGSSVVIIAGDPPNIVATLETAKRANHVAAAPDGSCAAVSSYIDKTVTILERTPTPRPAH